MNRSQEIIKKKLVNTNDLTAYEGFKIWLSPIIIFLFSLIILYCSYRNLITKKDQTQNLFILGASSLVGFSICLLYATFKKLRVKFYAHSSTIQQKIARVRELQQKDNWRLVKNEETYFLFFENNILTPSYHITIVFTEDGYYINSFPFHGRVLDFGLSERKSNNISKFLLNCI